MNDFQKLLPKQGIEDHGDGMVLAYTTSFGLGEPEGCAFESISLFDSPFGGKRSKMYYFGVFGFPNDKVYHDDDHNRGHLIRSILPLPDYWVKKGQLIRSHKTYTLKGIEKIEGLRDKYPDWVWINEEWVNVWKSLVV